MTSTVYPTLPRISSARRKIYGKFMQKLSPPRGCPAGGPATGNRLLLFLCLHYIIRRLHQPIHFRKNVQCRKNKLDKIFRRSARAYPLISAFNPIYPLQPKAFSSSSFSRTPFPQIYSVLKILQRHTPRSPAQRRLGGRKRPGPAAGKWSVSTTRHFLF